MKDDHRRIIYLGYRVCRISRHQLPVLSDRERGRWVLPSRLMLPKKGDEFCH